MKICQNDLGIDYKNYKILPYTTKFTSRYLVCWSDTASELFKDFESAKNAIDKSIAKNYMHNIINNISQQIGVEGDVVLECIREMIFNIS